MEQTNPAETEIFFNKHNIYQKNTMKSSGNTAKLNSDLPAVKKSIGKKFLIENEPKAVIMLDQDGTIILIEGSRLEDFGLDKYELIGNSVHIANADKPLILKTISKAVLKKEKASSFDFDDSTYQVTIMPMWKNNREISGQIIIVTDITAIGENLKLGNSRDSYYRQLFDDSKDAIAILDKNERILDINESFEKMFGYQKSEITGKTIDALIVPPRLIEETADMALIIEHGETAQFESFRKTKTGDEIELLITGSKITTHSGETGYCRVYSDISVKKKEEERMKTSLLEKELLLKEIHHRVKNNLQIISSLLLMQARSLKDKEATDILLESQNRIKSIALIHEKMYQTVNLSRVDFDMYLKTLIPHLTKSFKINSERIEISVNAQNVFLSSDTAIPCALIINELVTYSLKYSFPFDRKGKIDIELKYHNNNKLTLRVKDNGVGVKQNPRLSDNKSIGLQLIGVLVKQLDGKMDISNGDGTEYKINFSIE